jgi:hypothetical protein
MEHTDRQDGRPEIGSNVLLKGKPLAAAGYDRCADLLAVGQSECTYVLLVSITGSPHVRAQTVGSLLNDDPEEVAVIATSPDSGTSATDFPSKVPAVSTTISNRKPSDLTGLGVSIMDHFSDWQDDDATIAVCLDSITPLLQYNGLDEVFHFLRIVTDEVESADAVAHYHFDPTAHDDQTEQRLCTLFDRIVHVTPE